MDDNFSNFPEIIVQKLHSLFLNSNFYFLQRAKVFCKFIMNLETEVCSYR